MSGQIERDKRCLDNTNECEYRGRKIGVGDNPTTYECNHKEKCGQVPIFNVFNIDKPCDKGEAEYKDFGQLCLVRK